jgi:uncharacterized protein (UPF0276 family)
MADQFGLGWRKDLAAGIFLNQSKIDFLEVIADDFYKCKSQDLKDLKILFSQIPVSLHGVSMGLASHSEIPTIKIEEMKKLIDFVQPISWSEHIAFVRAGPFEIGHLASPPRNESTLKASLHNIDRIKSIISKSPLLENVASLIEPPLCEYTEGEFAQKLAERSSCFLLLDLHNLYANAVNFKKNPFELLNEFPLEKVKQVHLSGGRLISEHEYPDQKRLLDDHLHNVPEKVFELLTHLARQTPQDLSILIERDGEFPAIEILLDQLHTARQAVRAGRALAKKDKIHECQRI